MHQTEASKFDIIKRINRSMVLDKIKSSEEISRTEIAKDLKLSKATVSSIIEELVSRKLVEEMGKGKSTERGGRKRSMLRFNPSSKIGIGVDIGGTKIQMIMTDLIGNKVYERRIASTNKMSELIDFIEEAINDSQVARDSIVSLGVGVPGFTNPETGMVFESPALQWRDVPLREQLQEAFSFPVFINNDVNCAALGERWLGSGDNRDHIFFIAIGTGIGSAIISEGKLIYGADFMSGEIGYQISREDIRNKRFNQLKKFGVFESKASGEGIRTEQYSAEEVFEQYRQGKEEAVLIINEFMEELAVVIVNSINLLNPEKVVIGGGVSESMAVVLPKLQARVDELTPIKTEIELATLSSMAGAIGAVNYSFQEVEENNLL
ncbi:ROK family transcriptional regulator [Gracilibacillus phocaeensis]|uniref:ROK family transcriptional regulator n=1 Tax=Gracilibacillus phocaeensis TaxID=2042304 RepID=UPI0013EF5853|nr:ROK family transcriptional regulator [Gracilibacillus phocaeensis]